MVKSMRSLALASVCLGVVGVGCSTDRSGGSGDVEQVASALTGTLSADFEDGGNDGWIPRGSGVSISNSTVVANTGTHSLLTTGRTSGFMGPSIDLDRK